MNEPDTPLQGRIEDGIHRLPVRVYYEDTDFTGIVYYANYLKFLERGRTDFLRCAGVGHAALAELDPPLGFAIGEVHVKFLKPACIDDALTVETQLDLARGARLKMSQRVLRGDTVLIEAAIQAACIDFAGHPRRLPATLSEQISKHARSVLKSS